MSIIIPTLNEERHLPLLLESLIAVTSPLDIIVVDGNSEDRTEQVTKEFAERFNSPSSLRFIQSSVRNISAQRNIGAKAAKHSTFVFLDADVIVPSNDSFARLLIEFYTRGLSAGNARFIPHPHERNSRFVGFFTIIRTIQHVAMLLKRPFLAGACIITRRDSFEHVGGFDESVRLAEDVDYARRILPHGTCGLLDAEVSTSLRRLQRMTLREAYVFAKHLPRFLRTGKAHEEMYAHYTFGDYD